MHPHELDDSLADLESHSFPNKVQDLYLKPSSGVKR